MQLENYTDALIIKEAAKRLVERVKQKTGMVVSYGTFTLTIHEDQCTTIDFNYRDRCFDIQLKKDIRR